MGKGNLIMAIWKHQIRGIRPHKTTNEWLWKIHGTLNWIVFILLMIWFFG